MGVLANSNEQMLEAVKAVSNKLKIKEPSLAELRSTDARLLLKELGVGTFRAWRMLSFCQNYLTRMPSPPLTKGMHELLLESKSTCVLGIVSTSTEKRIADFIKTHQLDGVFDFIYSSVPLWGKDRVLWKLSCEYPALKFLYIGDEERDIICGQKAGYRVIAVSWGAKDSSFLKRYAPDYFVSTVGMFRDLLKSL